MSLQSPARHGGILKKASRTGLLQCSDLHVVAKSGDLPALIELILAGTDVNTRDSFTQTPLHWAAQTGNVEIVKALIQHGAKVNAKDKNGFSPLHSAASAGERSEDHLLICRILLDHGAESNAVTNNTTSAMHYLARYPYSASLLKLLKVLVLKGVDVDVTEKEGGDTPMHQAAFRGAPQTVEFFLEWGADLNQINKCGETPLHMAVRGGKLQNIKLLLKYKANKMIESPMIGTALDVAKLCGSEEILNLLLQDESDSAQQEDKDADDLDGAEGRTSDEKKTASSQRSLFSKGINFVRSGNYDKGVSFLRLAMSQGHAAAANELGWMYRRGIGVEQSDAQAFQCYREGAQKNDPNALHNVGFMYEHGFGVERSNESARKYYSKAVKSWKAQAAT